MFLPTLTLTHWVGLSITHVLPPCFLRLQGKLCGSWALLQQLRSWYTTSYFSPYHKLNRLFIKFHLPLLLFRATLYYGCSRRLPFVLKTLSGRLRGTYVNPRLSERQASLRFVIDHTGGIGRKCRTRTALQAPKASVLPLHHILYIAPLLVS